MNLVPRPDSEPVLELQLNNIEIVIDEDYPDRVELYKLDTAHNRIEGGTFNRTEFMDWILEFYNRNY